MHGIANCINRYWVKSGKYISEHLSCFLTFMFFSLSLMVFRSATIGRAFELFKSLLGFNGFEKLIFFDRFRICFEGGSLKISLFLISAVIIMTFFMKNSIEYAKRFEPNKVYLTATILMFLAALLNLSRISEFLYFQF